MRILVAPDSFKGSLTSFEAAEAMVAGIKLVMPDVEIISMPLADGGEGTLDVLHLVYGGDVEDGMLHFSDGGVSCTLIESAGLIGLTLPEMRSDVFDRGSAKLGQTVLAALGAGVQDIRIALGGSATVDGGLGFLAALGCRVLNHAGEPVSSDLNGMMQTEQIDAGGIDQRLKRVRVSVLCDVQNPLCGSQGAVHLYGPQKGIPENRLKEVEAAMRRWAGLCEQAFGVSVACDAGAAAAGGLGFALKLLGAQAVSGAEYVMHACGFDQMVKTVDWVLTGEGKSDAQTLYGKLPAIVAAQARNHGAKTALISGMVEQAEMMKNTFDAICFTSPAGFPVHKAMANARSCLLRTTAQWADSLL